MRWLVLGCSGSGKSTLAGRLGALLELPVVHLDQLYFGPGWKPVERDDEFARRIDQAVSGERWVLDGNYVNFLPPRVARATHVVFLDLPRWQCLLGVLLRWARCHPRRLSRPASLAVPAGRVAALGSVPGNHPG